MERGQPSAVEIPVLVVGAGPAGLVTSLLLARHGVRSLLVERHSGTSVLPRATGINIRTMEIFRILGLAEDIANQAMQFSGSSPLFLDLETLSGPTLNTVGFDAPLHSEAAGSPSPVLGTQIRPGSTGATAVAEAAVIPRGGGDV